MNNKFTVEEINLIYIFESRSRTKVISGIKEAIKYLDDEAMIELSLQVMQKLIDMSDEQFEELVFVDTE